ncbi:MAG: HD-GYP domain-containing protein [Solirubrobacteraceae bacterium]|nr:HD-GYP domain-containing protein [Solirubrobacteraceae bacterium]
MGANTGRELGGAVKKSVVADYDRLVVARFCGWTLVGLAAVGALAVGGAVAVGEEPSPAGWISVIVGMVSGLALLRWGSRLPLVVSLAIPFWAAGLISLTVLVGPGEARVVLVVPVLCLAYVGRTRLTIALTASIGVVYAVALQVNDDLAVTRPLASWVSLMAAVTASAYLMHRIRKGADAEAGALISMARALDLRDTGTSSHSTTVADLAERLGLAAGLSADRSRSLGLAGVLHDVGKIGVPDAVLQKSGPLTDDEWVVMRSHAEMGKEIVESAGLNELAGWIGKHHERLDGSGYPNGLAGDEIPVEARILAITDSYEAITTTRPYQEGRSSRDALAILRRESSARRLDPVLVGLLHEVVSERSGAGPVAVSDRPKALV